MKNINFNPLRKLESNKEPKKMPPSLEFYPGVDCHVSVDPPCVRVEYGSGLDFFKKYGFLVVRGIWDPSEFKEDIPRERGSFTYHGSLEKYSYSLEEGQVEGSLARYNHPKYKYAHSQIRLKLEKILQEELYNTYYYERFYFSNQKLNRHRDRPSCEISFTYQISSNRKDSWPLYFQGKDGNEYYVNLEDGDGAIYLGCDLDHWRNPLKSRHNIPKRILNKLSFKSDDTCHHQVFFHYVRANGERSHFAGDNG